MSRKNVFIMILLGLMLSIAIISTGCFGSDDVDMEAATFKFESLDSIDALMEDIEGKVTFVNIWGKDCPYCLDELPHINELYQNYADDEEVEVITINFTDSASDVKGLMEDEGYVFDVYLDEEEEAVQYFEVLGLPSNYLVDADGEIVFENPGAMSYDEAEQAIEDAR